MKIRKYQTATKRISVFVVGLLLSATAIAAIAVFLVTIPETTSADVELNQTRVNTAVAAQWPAFYGGRLVHE